MQYGDYYQDGTSVQRLDEPTTEHSDAVNYYYG